MLRAFFIALSENKSLRHFSERSSLGQRMSRRFVAGMSVEDCLRATRAVNELGMSVSVDNLGENVTNAEEAKHSAALYHQLLDRITEEKLNANVSMKLTHMGLDVNEQLAYGIATSLVEHAARVKSFVRVDMEGSPYTQRTLDFVHKLHADPQNKGEISAAAKKFATEETIARDAFEFQMLYGIRRDLQQQLVKDGWRMRVYIPFGSEWYPYFMRRLAERPANVFFIAKNLFRK